MRIRVPWIWALIVLATLGLVLGCNDRSSSVATIADPQKDLVDAGPPVFEDVTAASGVKHTYRNGEETASHLSILESLGGGAGLIDYDGDGLLDIFLPGGGAFAGADKKDIVGLPCKLYRNLG